MVKHRVWCYATKRHVQAEGEITPGRWFKPKNCEHEDCADRHTVDCVIGKIRYLPPQEVKPT